MQKYPWPGNVRELQHVMERAVIMNKGYTLQAEDLFLNTRQAPEAEDQESVVISNFNLEHIEKIMIQKILKKYHGSVTQASRETGPYPYFPLPQDGKVWSLKTFDYRLS